MRIALNLLFVAPGVAGGRVYAEGLLRGLAAADRENGYLCYLRRDTPFPELPREQFHFVPAPVSGTSTLRRALWEYGVLPRDVAKSRADLFHGLGNLSPAVKTCPFVLTIH